MPRYDAAFCRPAIADVVAVRSATLNRCRSVELAACRPAVVRCVIGPLQWRNWPVAACASVNRVRERSGKS
eukprot:scaffold113530_cov75-Phaeocystis_antarctica.AAC.2